MSVAGLVMMHITRNRFVSPSTAGTAESATLGVLVATVLFGAEAVSVKMAVAVAFALLGTCFFMVTAAAADLRGHHPRPARGHHVRRRDLAVTTFFAYRYDLLQSLSAWTAVSSPAVLRAGTSCCGSRGAVTRRLPVRRPLHRRRLGRASRSTSACATTAWSTPGSCSCR